MKITALTVEDCLHLPPQGAQIANTYISSFASDNRARRRWVLDTHCIYKKGKKVFKRSVLGYTASDRNKLSNWSPDLDIFQLHQQFH